MDGGTILVEVGEDGAIEVVSPLVSTIDGKRRLEVATKTVDLFRNIAALAAPPVRLKGSDWADAHVILPDTSAFPGNWHTAFTPYLREPMDKCTDSSTRKMVLLFASQTGKTALLLNIMGYFMDHDPCPIMMLQPTLADAQKFSKNRVAPMIRDCPVLRSKVADVKSRDSNNTILEKSFPGGFLNIVGTNSPSGLASTSNRVGLVDELDRHPLSAGHEGSPLAIFDKRMTAFWNSLLVVASTPTIKGESAIESEYEHSSQGEWHIPCPTCGVYQIHDWERIVFIDATMRCCSCGCCHTEAEWDRGEGKWVHRYPDHPVLGYFLNALASPFPKAAWTLLIEEWHDANAKGPEILKTFINTRLAQTWEIKGEKVEEELLDRCEVYDCDIPIGALLLTAGADVHPNRIEMEVVGWGVGYESWGIQYKVFNGDPNNDDIWDEVDDFLKQIYRRKDGQMMPIQCACIDSGYAKENVYKFTRTRLKRRVFAIKGDGIVGKLEVSPFTRQGKNRDVLLFSVGTNASKDTLLTRLNVEKPGPGYCHFPSDSKLSNGSSRHYDKAYFDGLRSEKRIPKTANGRVYSVWEKIRSHGRNEPLDCRVYAGAAVRIINPNWKAWAAAQSSKAGAQQPPTKRRRGVLSSGVKV